MIDKELLKRWIDALRSRKYKQGKGCLRSKNNTYCCVGVLCDLYDQTRWTSETNFLEQYEYNSPVGEFHQTVPTNIRNQIGLSDGLFSSLYKMNDNGAKFYQIARKLERILNKTDKNGE